LLPSKIDATFVCMIALATIKKTATEQVFFEEVELLSHHCRKSPRLSIVESPRVHPANKSCLSLTNFFDLRCGNIVDARADVHCQQAPLDFR